MKLQMPVLSTYLLEQLESCEKSVGAFLVDTFLSRTEILKATAIFKLLPLDAGVQKSVLISL